MTDLAEFSERITKAANNALTVFVAQMQANGHDGEEFDAILVFASPVMGVGCAGTVTSGYMNCMLLAQAISATAALELHRIHDMEVSFDGDVGAERADTD